MSGGSSNRFALKLLLDCSMHHEGAQTSHLLAVRPGAARSMSPACP